MTIGGFAPMRGVNHVAGIEPCRAGGTSSMPNADGVGNTSPPRHCSIDSGLEPSEPTEPQSIFGRVSNWWYGGGEEIVHSSVVAPSPQGLSPAGLPATIDQIRLTKNTTMPAAMIM